jgi:hypothetical protein
MTPEREQLKKQYGSLYDTASGLLFESDPIGINFEDNTDEYEPEAATILPRLASVQTWPDGQVCADASRRSQGGCDQSHRDLETSADLEKNSSNRTHGTFPFIA